MRTIATRKAGPVKRTAAGNLSGRRKDGTFKPFRVKPHACKFPACKKKVLALDLCRMHYDRQRKHGDPALIGKAGAPKFAPEALAEAGITARQRNHWAGTGMLGVGQDPTSGRYVWNAAAISAALLTKRLLDSGFSLELSLRIARALIHEGADQVEVGDGVLVRVDHDHHEVPL